MAISMNMQHLINMLSVNNYQHILGPGGEYLAVPHKVVTSANSGLKEGKLLATMISERSGVWVVIHQTMLRKVEDEEGLYSLKNGMILLNGAVEVYKTNHPYMDANNSVAVEWEVEEPSVYPNGDKFIAVSGTFKFSGSPVSVFELLKVIGDIPEVELVNIEDVMKDDDTHPTPETKFS